MRDDAIGMFWQDLPTSREQKKYDRPMPSIPDWCTWRPPTYLPDLSQALMISIDTETYDPDLLEFGPGWARGKGHIVGVSVGAYMPDGSIHSWYFPIRHETEPGDNWDPETVLQWLRHTLANPKQPKVGANLYYDVGWLLHEGVPIVGKLYDVQYAEALLDETAKVSLEIIAQKYLGIGKESEFMYEWLAAWFGGQPDGKQRKWIYRSPPRIAGPYAESDADLPLRLIMVMWDKLQQENLLDLFDMECRLIPLIVAMRFRGVRVDVAKAEEIGDRVEQRAIETNKRLNSLVGFEVNVNANDSIGDAFTALGLPFARTKPSTNYPEGKPSFTKLFLESVEHPVAELILETRKLQKLGGTFIKSYILNSHIDGRLFCQFHQLRGDSGGTRSGRYSSSTPNLQNIPSRDDELAPLIRGLFIPDQGHKQWRKYDYSQIEYRMLLHHAIGHAGDEVRRFFNAHPDTDYHIYAQEVVESKAGLQIPRKSIKTINFGLIYGMGIPKLCRSLGLSKKDGDILIKAYFEGVPFAKPTMEAAMEEALQTGVITTILGRKSRFDLWEPKGYGEGLALPLDKAIRAYGPAIQRAYTHKALNRRLQGGAADIMKLAMLKCWEDGVFAETGVPLLTVHDELDFTDPGGKDEAFAEMKNIMETCYPLKIPIKADCDIGPDWGHVKEES